jgi:carboxypeptidase PM20D1
MDVKGGALGLLEALTALLQQGYQPTRTLLVALGHDEEVGGHGARKGCLGMGAGGARRGKG